MTSSGAGSLQLLAEHPTWTWAEAQALGSKADWTTLLHRDGFSASDIASFLGGKMTAAQLIAKHPATGTGNSSGIGAAASQGAQAIGSATGLSSVLSVLGFLTSPGGMLRLLEIVAGVVLIGMGLHQLAGGGNNPVVSGVKKAARAAL